MTSRKHRRSRKARRKVERIERVSPPPEAAQHRRPWPMQVLLQLGPPGGGIDSDEFEAALQIVEAFHAMTAGLGMSAAQVDAAMGIRPNGPSGMSDADARRIALWLAWSAFLPRGRGADLVAQIEDEQPITSVAGLRFACRLWDRVRSDQGKRSQGVDTTANSLTYTGRVILSESEPIAARAPNLPVQPNRLFPPPHIIPPASSLAGAQMRQATQRSENTHAHTTAAASAGRPRR